MFVSNTTLLLRTYTYLSSTAVQGSKTSVLRTWRKCLSQCILYHFALLAMFCPGLIRVTICQKSTSVLLYVFCPINTKCTEYILCSFFKHLIFYYDYERLRKLKIVFICLPLQYNLTASHVFRNCLLLHHMMFVSHENF